MRYMIDTYGNVDLGTLDWDISGSNFYAYYISNNIKKPKDDNTIANIYCNLYRAVPLNVPFVEGDMALSASGYLYIRDTRYTTTAEFKEAMRGQILRYELETPANGGYLPMYKGRYKVSDVCQLVDKSKYPATQTVNGITFTNNGDGSYTANGTLSSYLSYLVVAQVSNLIVGHKYYSPKASYVSGVYVETKILTNNANFIYITDNIHEWVENETVLYITLVTDVGQNSRVENVILKPQLFDLTEMYGVGNEPTTVAEFKQKFPNELYPYQPYCWAKIKQMRYKVSDVCQLSNKNTYSATQTVNGVTFTNNGDGTIIVDGTNTGTVRIFFTVAVNINLTDGHYYCMSGNAADWSANTYCTTFEIAGNGSDRDGEKIFKYTEPLNVIGTKNGFYIRISIGITVNNAIFKPQLFDLTEMYGAGNEPTTVEEFREKFPDELYPYSPKCYLPLK